MIPSVSTTPSATSSGPSRGASAPGQPTRSILAAAREVGFDRVAVAPVERLEAFDRLRRWLDADMHGSMGWMERNLDRRTDPTEVLPGARSLLVVALNYQTDHPPTEDPRRARISRYAWGDEYHRVVGGRLEELRERIEEIVPGTSSRPYVDTGPILEKAWAQRAGLGWIGKHTNLITTSHGSWLFLGVLLLDIELEAGDPHPDRCGTCRRCIDACPTDAIVAPYVLDSRRCIAYLTIENRGPIPREMRRPMGNRVFGCDDCQDVCPWNRFARESRVPEHFSPRAETGAPELGPLLRLDEEEFRDRFPDSPIRRAKRSGFLRNVAVALGNSGDPEAVAPLIDALEDRDALVRGHAAWALGELVVQGAAEGKRVRRALARRRPAEEDAWVRDEIEAARARAAPGRGEPADRRQPPRAEIPSEHTEETEVR